MLDCLINGRSGRSIDHTAMDCWQLMSYEEKRHLSLEKPTDTTTLIMLKHVDVYPGIMILSELGTSISAGILVIKNEMQWVTMAYHCWEELHKENPEKPFIKIYKVHLGQGLA